MAGRTGTPVEGLGAFFEKAADGRERCFQFDQRQAGDAALVESVLAEEDDGEPVVGEGDLDSFSFFLTAVIALDNTSKSSSTMPVDRNE